VCRARFAPADERERDAWQFIPNTQLGPLLDIHEARRTNSLLSETGGYLSVSIVSFLSRFCARRAHAFHINWQPFNDFVSSDRRESRQQHSPLSRERQNAAQRGGVFAARNQFCFGATRSPAAARVLERSGGGVLCLRANLYIY